MLCISVEMTARCAGELNVQVRERFSGRGSKLKKGREQEKCRNIQQRQKKRKSKGNVEREKNERKSQKEAERERTREKLGKHI